MPIRAIQPAKKLGKPIIGEMSSDQAGSSIEQSALAELLRSRMPTKGVKIDLHAHLVDDLNLDSLDMVELRAAVETNYKIEIDDAIWSRIQTVDDLATLVSERTNRHH